MNIGEGISGALFEGPDRRFRFALWRIWDSRKDKLIYNGLNPSTAQDIKDDPTVIRLAGFARYWGFGGFFAGNLLPFVTPNPQELWRWYNSLSEAGKEVVRLNDEAIKQMRGMCSKAMVGWGNEGKNAGTRPNEVLAVLGEPVYCIKTTKLGEPAHPLYMPLGSQLIPYVRG
ncbi:MAG: DUF1643 domain-containing protein [Dehalococcoidales bacterium]|nr:DUF1643 domain-containing protein [Dehalococcoidales bacterium]